MPRRDAVAYGSAAAGIVLAAALIRWMPVVPVSAVSKSAAAPKIDVFDIPVVMEDRVVLPDPPRVDREPSAIRRSVNVPVPRVSPVPSEKKQAERKEEKSIPPPVTDTALPSPVPPAPVVQAPSEVSREKPAFQMDVPVPVVAPLSRAAVLRARVSDPGQFKEKLKETVSRQGARFLAVEPRIRIEVSSDTRAALKAAINKLIFECLSDEGSDLQIELVSP